MENIDSTKIIVKTFLKTAVSVVIAMLLCCTLIIGAFPKFAVASFDDLGFSNVSVRGYEKIYLDEGGYANLYNLISVCDKYEKHSMTAHYAEVFVNDKSAQKIEFVKKMDESVLQHSSKQNYAYVASVDNYSLNMYLKSMYFEKGFVEAKKIALLSLGSGDFASFALCFGLDSLLELVSEDKTLTEEKKLEFFEAIYALNNDEKNFSTLLSEKEAVVNNQIILQTSCLTNEVHKFNKLALLSVKNSIKYCELNLLQELVSSRSGLDKTTMQSRIATLILDIKAISVEYNNLIMI